MTKRKIKLSEKQIINGKEVDTLELDFSKLTGNDLIGAEAMVRADGEMNPLLTFSLKYQAALAAKLMGIKYDDVLGFKANDFTRITTVVANFLMGQG